MFIFGNPSKNLKSKLSKKNIIGLSILFIFISVFFISFYEENNKKYKDFTQQASELAKDGMFNEAISVLDEAIHLIPNKSDAYIFKASFMVYSHTVPEVLSVLDVCDSKAGPSSLSYSLRASALLSDGQADKALVYADKAINLEPAQILANETKAKSLIILGKLDEAIPALQQCIKLKDDDLECWVYKGIAEISLNKCDDLKSTISNISKMNISKEELNRVNNTFRGGPSKCKI